MNSLARIDGQYSDALAPYRGNAGLVAMQYAFTLPADYDMATIRRRIADKGRQMDGFPGLVFKAFAYSAGDFAYPYSPSNCYAPFYLWRNHSGINRFLESDGFAALTRTFGWPVIKTWSVLYAQLREAYAIASWATREEIAIPPYTRLETLQTQEATHIHNAIVTKRILGGFAAFEPATWTLVRYTLQSTCPQQEMTQTLQVYQVGHLATQVMPAT